MTVTRGEIRAALRGLGVEAGETLVVHSSLSSMGYVEGGADAVVDGLLGAAGPEGTVGVPTFTTYADPYEPASTVSTTGAVTEALRERDTAARSLHPTKSVAAIGPNAADLLADHEPMNSLGPGSPIHRLLADLDGRVLLLGVDHTTNSALHVAERLAGVPYRDQTGTAGTAIGGEVREVTVNRVHCSRGFEVVAPLIREAGIRSRGRVGEAEAQLIDGPAMLELTVDLLDADPGALLCSVPDCDRCQYARERIHEDEN